MARCMAEAWERFCHERRGVIIRSFQCIGVSLPISGSFDGEILNKGLETPRLMTAPKDWKTRSAPATGIDSESDTATSNDDSDIEDLFDPGPLLNTSLTAGDSLSIMAGNSLSITAGDPPTASDSQVTGGKRGRPTVRRVRAQRAGRGKKGGTASSLSSLSITAGDSLSLTAGDSLTVGDSQVTGGKRGRPTVRHIKARASRARGSGRRLQPVGHC